MSNFAYIARDSSGNRVTGTVSAATEQAVVAELQSRELAPVKVREVKEHFQIRRGVSVRHLGSSYSQLADLLRVGMPLLRALQLIGRNKSNPRLAGVWSSIAEDIEEGARLGDAMAAHSDIFPPIQIAMVRAGERGAFLEQVLARLGSFLEQQADTRARVIGNMIYPLVLLSVGFCIVIGALVFFVPKFAPFYSRIEIPLPTKILLGASDALVNHWLLLIVAAAALIAAITWVKRQPAVRRAVAEYQLRIPKLGTLISSMAVARFTRILGTLLDNGVPLIQSMQISRDAVGHVLLAEAIDEAVEAVRAGEPLARPLAGCGVLSEDVSEMIAVGESANNLPHVLATIADTIEKRVDRMLTIFVRLMEPLLLLALAGVVLFIFVALIVPMVRLSGSI